MTVTQPIALPPIVGVLEDLVNCVCEQLSTNGAGPLCWCGLWHGDTVSWEYCGECTSGLCGMGYVRLQQVAPYSSFPLPEVDATCRRPLAYAVEIGALRCMPTMEPDGALPGPAAVAEAALGMVADMWALYLAAQCCQSATVAIDTYTPLGPQGGCAGGAWTIHLSTDG